LCCFTCSSLLHASNWCPQKVSTAVPTVPVSPPQVVPTHTPVEESADPAIPITHAPQYSAHSSPVDHMVHDSPVQPKVSDIPPLGPILVLPPVRPNRQHFLANSPTITFCLWAISLPTLFHSGPTLHCSQCRLWSRTTCSPHFEPFSITLCGGTYSW
jgi:hypothetical protein